MDVSDAENADTQPVHNPASELPFLGWQPIKGTSNCFQATYTGRD